MPRVTITVPDKNSQPYRFQLDRQVVTMGRGAENDIVIESGSVSGRHAEMHRVPGGYELRDAGSTNGIKLGGERYETVPLRHGASLKLGDVALDFVLTDEEMEALAREQPSEPSQVVKEKVLPAVPRAPGVPVRPVPQRFAPVGSHSSGGNGLMVVLFLVLAAVAFYVGLSIRHQKETGMSLLESVRARSAAPAAGAEAITPAAPAAPTSRPAAPAPAPAPAPVVENPPPPPAGEEVEAAAVVPPAEDAPPEVPAPDVEKD